MYHISDMHEMRKPLRRSKETSLAHLRRRLGTTPTPELTRDVTRFAQSGGVGTIVRPYLEALTANA